jgi:prevent-host-death family protein
VIYNPTVRMPVAGELAASLATAISGGQPVLLTDHGRPAAVLVDWDSWQELQYATETTSD